MKKREQSRNWLRFGFSIIILGVMVAVWAFFWMEYYAENILRPFGYKGNWLVFAVYGIISYFFTYFYGGYRIGYYKQDDIVYSGILSMIICNAVTYLQTCLVGRAIMVVRPFFIMTLLQMLLIWLWAVVGHGCYMKLFPPREMMMVYGGENIATGLLYKMNTYSEKYVVKEAVDICEGEEPICAKALEYGNVILCDLPAKARNRLLKFCFENGIRTYVTPKLSDILMRGSSEISLFDVPLLLNRGYGLSFEQRILKRLVDIVFSLIGLCVASPFIVLTALAIKLYDRGTVIYKQKRLTIGGREFYVYKFRSMIEDAEKKNGAQLSTFEDERITPVGRIIRRMRFDELPQLWNILKGDMSIVGPRPERPEIAAQLSKEIPEFVYRLKVKAGLTGYAQVVGRYNTTAYDKLKMDLMYITSYSLLQDFKLMLMTIKILFVKSSTEGVIMHSGKPNGILQNSGEKVEEHIAD